MQHSARLDISRLASCAASLAALLAMNGCTASHASAPALRQVVLFQNGIGYFEHAGLCLQGALADADAGAPGVQAACRVRVEQSGGTWTELSACGKDDDAACFEVVSDALSCGHTETGLAVDLARAAAEGARVQVECRVP